MLNGMLDGIPESGDRYIYSEYQAFFEDYWDIANPDESQSGG
jgi:hypothetical protein